ncbi:hypothetical protein ABZ829_05185 [Streptomyces xanthochromogenes]|uniref:hypothetical protein n=1 Tax=Streptomyces xanthochromogenes TaxID=67384 RepID=UPI003438845E
MSVQDAGPVDGEKSPNPTDNETAEGQDGPAQEQRDQPQKAWAARRDLYDHTPRTMRFGGGFIGGDNHGVSTGHVARDVIMGSKTEIFYQFGGTAHSSGEVPSATLERLAACFVTDEEEFAALARRLRSDRVLVLSGPHFAGRRTAALMLLRHLGAAPLRVLDRTTRPGELARQLGPGGQVLCDLVTERGRPLRESDLLAARDRLAEHDAYLVVTVDPRAALEDIPAAEWHPPTPGAVLAAHLRARVSPEDANQLLALPAVADFLARDHQLREAATYAEALAGYAAGLADVRAIERFSLASLESQVQEWFEEDEASLHLRDKAFLVALAAFDGGPYALTAELSDLLYTFLQQTENPAHLATVPVFGTHILKRLQRARARRYEEEEHTEWGPVNQLKAAFQDDRAALVLLREVWTGHPSARPALVNWLRRLAGDGRPLVRTRAAATVAVLAHTDLPSAMALIIEVWATDTRFRHRLVAVNALALTHLLGTPNVPRIIDDWCVGDDARLCWVAIRTHGLIGPERPEAALSALRGAARRQHSAEEPDALLVTELAQSVELLLLSPAGDEVLSVLVRTLHDDRAVFNLAVDGFLGACRRSQEDEPFGTPLILEGYARGIARQPDAAHPVAELWRAALGDRAHTGPALEMLRHWVLTADRDPATEWALAALLPALITSGPEHRRLDHLLRTMPGEDGTPPPLVASRLLTVLPPH